MDGLYIMEIPLKIVWKQDSSPLNTWISRWIDLTGFSEVLRLRLCMDCLLFVGRSLRGAENRMDGKSPGNFLVGFFFGKDLLGKYLGGILYDLLVFFCCLFVCVFFSYGFDSISKIPWDSSPRLVHHFYLGLDILGKSKVRFLRHRWTRWPDGWEISDRKEETKKRELLDEFTKSQTIKLYMFVQRNYLKKKESHILEWNEI